MGIYLLRLVLEYGEDALDAHREADGGDLFTAEDAHQTVVSAARGNRTHAVRV